MSEHPEHSTRFGFVGDDLVFLPEHSDHLYNIARRAVLQRDGLKLICIGLMMVIVALIVAFAVVAS